MASVNYGSEAEDNASTDGGYSDEEGYLINYNQVAYTPQESPLHISALLAAAADPPAAPVKKTKRPREEDPSADGEPPKKKVKGRKAVNQTDKIIDVTLKALEMEGALGVSLESRQEFLKKMVQLATHAPPTLFHIHKTENPETPIKTKADFEAFLAANPQAVAQLKDRTKQLQAEYYFKNLVINPTHEIVIHDAQRIFNENEKSKPVEERRAWKNLSPFEKNELFVTQNETRTWAKDIYRDAASTRQKMQDAGTPLWTILL